VPSLLRENQQQHPFSVYKMALENRNHFVDCNNGECGFPGDLFSTVRRKIMEHHGN